MPHNANIKHQTNLSVAVSVTVADVVAVDAIVSFYLIFSVGWSNQTQIRIDETRSVSERLRPGGGSS